VELIYKGRSSRSHNTRRYFVFDTIIELLLSSFWQLEDFLLGFFSPNNDYFDIVSMNNIPVAQLQSASLVEELLSLREGFVTFDCGNVS